MVNAWHMHVEKPSTCSDYIELGNCRKHHLGQNSALSDSERRSLQDEDHSGSRPHSFLGLCHMRSGMSSEQFRSGPEIAGSEESHQDETMRLKCGSLSC